MKPEDWLRQTVVVKVRNKLATWTREDIIAYANQEFETDDLTKSQIGELCEKLKSKKLEKPGKQFYPTRAVEATAVPVEFRMVDNPGKVGYDQTHWYLAGSRAELRFKTVADVTAWALGLIIDEPRTLWHEVIKRWRLRNTLTNFDLGRNQFPMDPVLEKAFSRKLKRDARMRTPLPDNATLRKQYWGLDRGDRLVGPDGSLVEVAEVRANLDTPPTITYKKVL